MGCEKLGNLVIYQSVVGTRSGLKTEIQGIWLGHLWGMVGAREMVGVSTHGARLGQGWGAARLEHGRVNNL